jgi:hypothetical protein
LTQQLESREADPWRLPTSGSVSPPAELSRLHPDILKRVRSHDWNDESVEEMYSLKELVSHTVLQMGQEYKEKPLDAGVWSITPPGC